MIENFKVNYLFEGHAHERPHFSLDIHGHNYKGMIHNDKIHWYHPHPQQRLEEDHLEDVESKVFDLMSNHLE